MRCSRDTSANTPQHLTSSLTRRDGAGHAGQPLRLLRLPGASARRQSRQQRRRQLDGLPGRLLRRRTRQRVRVRVLPAGLRIRSPPSGLNRQGSSPARPPRHRQVAVPCRLRRHNVPVDRRQLARHHRHRPEPEDAHRDEHVPAVARRQRHARRRPQHAVPAELLPAERVDARRVPVQVQQVHPGRRHRRQHLHAGRHCPRPVSLPGNLILNWPKLLRPFN